MNVPLGSVTIPSHTQAFQAIVRKLQWYRYSFSDRLASLVAIDSLVIFLAAMGAFALVPTLTGQPLEASTHWYWFIVLPGSWWLFAWLYDLYNIPSLHRRNWLALRLLFASLTYLALYLGLIPILSAGPTVEHFAFVALFLPLMFTWRWLYVAMLSIAELSHRTIIVGQGRRAQLASELVKQESLLNYQLLGYIQTMTDRSEAIQDGLPIYNLLELSQLVRQLQVHEIIVATEGALDKQLALFLIECRSQGIHVLGFPELYERHRRNVPIDQIDPGWAVDAVCSEPKLLQEFIKRLIDLTIVLFALPILLIVTLLIAVAIKLDSHGPLFYRHIRLGLAGKPFWIIKFRTMYVDAEKDGKARWATENDPRITRVGRFLRKTRLDEIPQSFNILRGEMSLVGPRPERPEFIEQLEQHIPYYRTRLLVKPGLTGWAQIHYNYTSSIEDTFTKLQYDLYYVHRRSAWTDLYILFRTVAVVLQFKGT
jgi:exopolysaccharide biosynthesis polyprenyl glycosylphosphotransferase